MGPRVARAAAMGLSGAAGGSWRGVGHNSLYFLLEPRAFSTG
jgi:hypothetical protein